MINNSRAVSLIFLLLTIISCNENKEVASKQDNIINQFLHEDPERTYYPDSSLKEVYQTDSMGKMLGRVLRFSKEGILDRLYFVNKAGDTLGDDSRFINGNLAEHFFRLNGNTNMFYAKFKPNGKLDYFKGSPFFISGTSRIKQGDTLSFYIATPIIPGFQTDVCFGQNGVSASQVSYINDLRQFTYRKVMAKKGECEFCLHVQIRDSIGDAILEDRDTIQVFVF